MFLNSNCVLISDLCITQNTKYKEQKLFNYAAKTVILVIKLGFQILSLNSLCFTQLFPFHSLFLGKFNILVKDTANPSHKSPAQILISSVIRAKSCAKSGWKSCTFDFAYSGQKENESGCKILIVALTNAPPHPPPFSQRSCPLNNA